MASFEKDLTDFVQDTQKNFHFAEVVALTRVAKDSQKDVKINLDKVFTLRNKHTQRGIRIAPARKEQRHPFSEVFSLDKYIAEQEEGTSRHLKSGGEFWKPAHDFYSFTGAKKNKRIPKRLQPKRIMNTRFKVTNTSQPKRKKRTKLKGALPFRVKARGGEDAILVRKTDARLPVASLYRVSKKPQKISKKPWFVDQVNKSFDENIEKRYDEAVDFAFR